MVFLDIDSLRMSQKTVIFVSLDLGLLVYVEHNISVGVPLFFRVGLLSFKFFFPFL